MLELSEGDALAERYELVANAGDAGAYRQWHAVDRTLARDVTAITFPEDDPHAAAALDSARRAAGVDDHHLLRILDVGTESGMSYVVTERLHDAESVAELLQFQTLPAEEARRIIGEAATGLHTAAARGLHHLTLSPHDILRSRDGAVTVLGVATDSALAGLDDVPATVASRTDTEDLVRILYAALTGQWPGPNPVPGMPDGNNDEVRPPAQVVTSVPSDLDAVCSQVLTDGAGPRTPGELARLLSPWSAERVHGNGGRDVALASDDELTAAPALASPVKHYFDDDTSAALPPSGSTADPDETQQHDLAAFSTNRPLNDPSVVDLEPPAPGLPQGFEEPDRHSSGLALGIVAGLLVLTVIAAFFGLRGIGGGDATDAAPSSTKTSSSTTKATATPSPSATTPAGTAIKPVSADGFDPDGDGNEHNELAARVIDGDTSTSWITHIYRTAEFSGIKKGAGLILDLGSSKQVGSVGINVNGSPTTIQVFVTDKKNVEGSTPWGTLSNGSGEQTVRGETTKGRYVILWITELSQDSSNRFRNEIAEVKVLS